MAKIQKVNPVLIEENFEEEETVYKMLAGYTDEDGVIHKDFTLREINGKDEEALHSSNKKANGAAIVSLLLERCVTSIGNFTRKDVGTEKWREIIKSLYVGDQDYMLLKLREVSVGSEFEIKHECPECGAELITYVAVDELEIEPFKGEYFTKFTLPKGFRDKNGELHREGTIRPATGLDREILTPVAKKNVAVGTSMMLTRLCTFDGDIPITQDTMAELTIKDRNYLQELMKENLFGVNTEIEIHCDECGDIFKATFNPQNFI